MNKWIDASRPFTIDDYPIPMHPFDELAGSDLLMYLFHLHREFFAGWDIRKRVFKFSVGLVHVFHTFFASNSNPETTRFPAALKVAGARLLIPESPNGRRSLLRRRIAGELQKEFVPKLDLRR